MHAMLLSHFLQFHSLQLLSVHGISQSKITGVGCHFLLQGSS